MKIFLQDNRISTDSMSYMMSMYQNFLWVDELLKIISLKFNPEICIGNLREPVDFINAVWWNG